MDEFIGKQIYKDKEILYKQVDKEILDRQIYII